MEKTKLLGMNISNINMENAIKLAREEFLSNNKMNIIITPNPEILLRAENDEEFKKIINEADLVIPDGIGVVYASYLTKNKIKSRVGGLDFTMNILSLLNETSGNIYILGTKPEIVKAAAENIEKEFSNLKVVGYRDGYYKLEEEQEIVNEISKLNVDYLILALGAPRQEKFMYKYKDVLNVKMAIGNGGAVDVIAGVFKRAPIFWQKTGFEWLYRAIIDPSRFPRLVAIPKFILKVFIAKLKGTL